MKGTKKKKKGKQRISSYHMSGLMVSLGIQEDRLCSSLTRNIVRSILVRIVIRFSLAEIKNI
jgi:hypothetical protein